MSVETQINNEESNDLVVASIVPDSVENLMQDVPEEGEEPPKKKRRPGAPVQLPYMKDLPDEERRARVADLARTRNQIFRELRKNHAVEVAELNNKIEQLQTAHDVLQREVEELRPKAAMSDRLQSKVMALYGENRSLNKRLVDALEQLMHVDTDIPLVQYTDK